jgi:phage replication-related protein YjqB (UPF0714/DUF867 family)
MNRQYKLFNLCRYLGINILRNSHKDKYTSFKSLSNHEREEIDFRIILKNRNATTTLIAPHGGKIESMTSQIATAIAGQEFNLYCFEGIKNHNNYKDLHITSHHFDEPKCIQIISHSRYVIAIHGCSGDNKMVYVGGLDKTLRQNLASKLKECGFNVKDSGHSFPGEEETNICNRGITGAGVQFELSKGLRYSLMINEFIEVVRVYLLNQKPDSGVANI